LCPGGGLKTAAQTKVGQRIAATDRQTAVRCYRDQSKAVFPVERNGLRGNEEAREEFNCSDDRKVAPPAIPRFSDADFFPKWGEQPVLDVSGHGERERFFSEKRQQCGG